MLPDTRALFHLWDAQQSVAGNLTHVRQQNLLGKPSRSRVAEMLTIFRWRYLRDAATARALATLVQGNLPAQTLDPIFYFYAAQADALLHDVVVDLLATHHWPGQEVPTAEVYRFIAAAASAGPGRPRGAAPTTRGQTAWSPSTTERVTQGLLSALRDFGLLTGMQRKKLAPAYLPVEAFAFIAFVLNARLHSGDAVVQSREWRLFLLSPQQVERLFVEAQGHHLLTYHAAGSIVRIDFPAATLEEYALALAQRAR